MEHLLFYILTADAAFKAAIGLDSVTGDVKVYLNSVPQQKQLPYGLITLVSGVDDYSKDETGFLRLQVQLDMHAKTALEAKTLAELAHTALDNYRGTVQGVFINRIRRTNIVTDKNLSPLNNRRTFEYSLLIAP